jgi:hypothetical protein
LKRKVSRETSGEDYSVICRKKKARFHELYGIANPSQSDEIMKKAVERRKELHGTTSTKSSELVRERMEELHGVPFNLNNYQRRRVFWDGLEFEHLQGYKDYALCEFKELGYPKEKVLSQPFSFGYTKSNKASSHYTLLRSEDSGVR